MPSVSTTASNSTARASAWREPAAEQQVLPHGEMREELRVLVDEADPAVVLGHEDVLLRVHQHAIIDDDHAAVRPQQAGEQAESDGLARAGSAEQRDARGTLERRLVGEGAELDRSVEADHSNWVSRRCAKRWTISETTRAPSAITMAMAVSRQAISSPPGT